MTCIREVELDGEKKKKRFMKSNVGKAKRMG